MVLRRGEETNLDGFSFDSLEVKDERFGDQIFRGTAKEIYEEMKNLKPELFTEELGNLVDDVSDGTSIAKRQGVSSLTPARLPLGALTSVEAQLQVGQQPPD